MFFSVIALTFPHAQSFFIPNPRNVYEHQMRTSTISISAFFSMELLPIFPHTNEIVFFLSLQK